MKIENILAYQKKDIELIKLQKSLDNNADKKAFEKQESLAKQLQSRSSELEKEAGDIIKEIENLKKSYAENSNSANVITSKNLEEVDNSVLDNMSSVASNISSNLNILEKKILQQAERVNAVLGEFNDTKKKYNDAKESHKFHKAKFEEFASQINPKIEEIQKELKALEKDIDETALQKYQKRREKQPVFVPLLDKSCGGCQTEMPLASLEKLKTQGYLDCEYCGRIIYNK
ncbi:MAG: hypothetical protein IJA69_01745 [Clostridia bacterium]|nr:hypothetical protein [Clostridia bacterium]